MIMIRFIIHSLFLGKFFQKNNHSFKCLSVDGNTLKFQTDEGEVCYEANDVQCIGLKSGDIIDVSDVRYDWLGKDLLGIMEQPITVIVTKNKISFTLSY